MKLTFALALFFLALPGLAATPNAEAGAKKAHPDLLRLEQDLTRKQAEKKEGLIEPEHYQEWETEFRGHLESTLPHVLPSPENTAARARIAAMLGERGQAGASLDEALESDPENPILLRTKGQLHYENQDYPGAAQLGLQAWEKSGRTDLAALALYQSAKGRRAPSGANSSSPSAGSAASQSVPVAPAADTHILPVKGGAKTAEVPAVAVDAVPAESNGGGLGLLTTLGIGAGILMIAWGAVPQETKDHFKEVLWEQPKKEVKVVAAATAVVGAVYLAATFLPPLLVTTLPSAPALTPALAGGGMAGGGMALQPAAVGTVKAALLAGGGTLVLKKAGDNVSYSKSEETTSHASAQEREPNPFSSEQKLDEHYSKHVLNQKEFGNISKAEYGIRAKRLRDISPDGKSIVEHIRPDGVKIKFNKTSGEFGAYNSDGIIRTHFRPQKGWQYFVDQIK